MPKLLFKINRKCCNASQKLYLLPDSSIKTEMQYYGIPNEQVEMIAMKGVEPINIVHSFAVSRHKWGFVCLWFPHFALLCFVLQVSSLIMS